MPPDGADPRRELLLTLLQTALQRVDGRASTRAALAARGEPVSPPGGVWIAAIGKAAAAMALGAHDALGVAIGRTLVITRAGHVAPGLLDLGDLELLESAHPVPDERSLAAGARLLRWVDELPPTAAPLFLISGGASSLVEVLAAGASLDALLRLNQQGLAAGIPIGELNARRRSLSRIKGGGLAARLGGRPARALFISDVPGNDPGVIGSGLMGVAPAGDKVRRTVIASADDAVAAVAAEAQRRGFRVHAGTARFDGPATRLAARFAHELRLAAAEVLVWGGESTVQLPPAPGRGGRNQHLALAAAKLIAGEPDLLLLAAGTDGTDGVTEDAGALVDADTCARIALAGLDPDASLRQADAGTALAASGDLVHTGPTGTNVGDVVIGLKMTAVRSRARQRVL
ncbi:MAG: glycerate kinase [Steroidobacteraceae bacterium]